MDDDTPVFVISVAAELAGMHPQTLRQYDRIGLVTPGRSGGGGRRYSARDIALLRQVQRLSQEDGVSLPGIKRIIELEHQVEALQARVSELAEQLVSAATALERAHLRGPGRRDLVPLHDSALVVWRPAQRSGLVIQTVIDDTSAT